MSDGGKGSKPRPFSVNADTFAHNWDRIFKKEPLPASNQSETPDAHGSQRINNQGLLEEYHEGYWSVVPFRSRQN